VLAEVASAEGNQNAKMEESSLITASSSAELTSLQLPEAIGHILTLNNYDVSFGRKVHGAEIDIVATPKSDPFQSPIYIEATVQYVDGKNRSYALSSKSLASGLLARSE
jgi:hypothetical protein